MVWKVSGDLKQQPQGASKVSLALPAHISSWVQTFWRNCMVSLSVKLTTQKKTIWKALWKLWSFAVDLKKHVSRLWKGTVFWIPVKRGMNESCLTISPSASAQSSRAVHCHSSLGETGWGSQSAQSGFPSGYMVGICHRHLAEHRTFHQYLMSTTDKPTCKVYILDIDEMQN